MFFSRSIILFLCIYLVKPESKPCDDSECIDLKACPKLLKIIQKHPKPRKYLENFTCGNENEKVCCEKYLEISKINETNERNELISSYSNFCGVPDDTVYFPWLASVLVFGHKFCSGALINSRYVLTSAMCASPQVHNVEGLTIVILGDVNLKNNNLNCTEYSNEEECNELQMYSVDKAIQHQFYSNVTSEYFNNIGLLKLDRTVVFTDFIRPICLPTSSIPIPKPNTLMYTSTWDTHFDPDLGKNRTKTMLSTKTITNKKCEQIFNTANDSRIITSLNMCTFNTLKNTDCLSNGEEGGPLMRFINDRWYIDGIMVIYERGCDSNKPIIYTNVSVYLDWIQDSISRW